MVQAQLRAGLRRPITPPSSAPPTSAAFDTAALAAFKANMQAMVDARRLSLTQALGFDIEYSGGSKPSRRGRLEAINGERGGRHRRAPFGLSPAA
jgi:hypothetical protein